MQVSLTWGMHYLKYIASCTIYSFPTIFSEALRSILPQGKAMAKSRGPNLFSNANFLYDLGRDATISSHQPWQEDNLGENLVILRPSGWNRELRTQWLLLGTLARSETRKVDWNSCHGVSFVKRPMLPLFLLYLFQQHRLRFIYILYN